MTFEIKNYTLQYARAQVKFSKILKVALKFIEKRYMIIINTVKL